MGRVDDEGVGGLKLEKVGVSGAGPEVSVREPTSPVCRVRVPALVTGIERTGRPRLGVWSQSGSFVVPFVPPVGAP